MLNKKIADFFAQAKQTTAKIKEKTNTSQPNDMASFEQIDKQVVSTFNNSRWPSWAQLKHTARFLNPFEKKVLKITVLVALISLVGLIISFYWTHTILIPTNGGSYTEGLVGSPNYINPLLAQYNDVDRDISHLIFNGLLKYDQQGSLVLDLASELAISPDQKEYTFTIKDNIFWHDGEQLTTDDIVFTIISIQDPNWQSPYRLSFANVNVEKIDDYHVKFTTKEPLANFIHSLTVGILPEHLWLAVPSSNVTLAELNKKPIGTGPFKFASLTKDKNGNIRTMVLERNNEYFDKAAYLESITFKFYGDYETGGQALKNDNVEGLNLLPKEYLNGLDKKKNLILNKLSLPQYTAVFFNTSKNSLLKDKALRQALAYAIDRQAILNGSANSQGQLINSPILPGYSGYTNDVTTYNYNPDLANQLLDKTGWLKNADSTFRTKGGDTLTFTITTVENPEYQQAIELIKNNWEAVGIKTELQIISKDRIKSDIIETRNYEALLFGQIIKSDPYPFWHSSQNESPGVNLSVWGHKGVDDLLEKSRITTNEEERANQLIEFQKILTENAPAIFLYNPVHVYPVIDYVKGIDTKNIISPADRFNNITNWYTKTKREFSWSQPSEQ